MTDYPHAYDCRCQQCSAMAAAINAKSPDGTFFFSDVELLELSRSENSMCDCDHCQQLRAIPKAGAR